MSASETALTVTTVTTAADLPATFTAALDRAADLATAEKAEATRKAYKSDFRIFRAWCGTQGVVALPAAPETVAAFVASEAERGTKASTIGRRVAAIRYAHKLAGASPLPTDDERVKATVRGARRTLGVAPVKKTPATSDRLIAMAPLAGVGSLIDCRDRALLLLGFAGAFRRSELVALDLADIAACPEGLRVTIRKSKTDQEGTGTVIAIPRGAVACPVVAVAAWIAAAGIASGPLFRSVGKGGRVSAAALSDKSVANIVKAHAERLGFDPASFGGHSLRAGFLTSAAARGANLFKMAAQSRHKSIDVLRGYVRDAEIFKDHAGTGLL